MPDRMARMRGRTSTAGVACAAVVLAVGALVAQGATNPGFELNTGNGSNPSGWTTIVNSYGAYNGGGTIAPHSGGWMLHAGASSRSGGRYQDVATVPGRRYLLAFWATGWTVGGAQRLIVQAGTPGPDPASLTQNNNAEYVNRTNAVPLYVGALSWVPFLYSFTVTGTITRLTFEDYAPNNDSACNIDDVVFGAYGEVENGGFESNGGNATIPNGWSAIANHYGAYNGVLNGTTPRGGAWILHPGATSRSGGSYQDIATEAGHGYRLSFWAVGWTVATPHQLIVQVGTPGPVATSLTQNNNAECVNQTNGLPRYVTAASWVPFACNFRAPSTITRISFQNCAPASNASVNVDDVSLTADGSLYNGDFEVNAGNGTGPAGWVPIANSYGAFDGAADGIAPHGGAWSLHAGNSYKSGGRYQDVVTEPGKRYQLAFWATGWTAGGQQRVIVQAGTPGPVATSLTQNNNAEYLNQTGTVPLYTGPASWRVFNCPFTAAHAITRISFQNDSPNNDSAVSVDDVTLDEVGLSGTVLMIR